MGTAADIPERHQRWANLIHRTDREGSRSSCTRVSGGPRYDVEYRVIRLTVLSASSTVGATSHGTTRESLRANRVLQDVTELRQAERELRKNVALLEEAQPERILAGGSGISAAIAVGFSTSFAGSLAWIR